MKNRKRKRKQTPLQNDSHLKPPQMIGKSKIDVIRFQPSL